MITQSEEKPCVDPDVVKDLHETYAALQKEPKNTLEYKLQLYIEKQYKFDEELRKDCPIETEELKVPEAVTEVSPDAAIM
jgi:hypothetical protein